MCGITALIGTWMMKKKTYEECGQQK